MHRAIGTSPSITAVIAALCGCGRVAFDPLGDGGVTGNQISLVLPPGGQMTSLAIAPDGTWYAASDTSGVFRSDDHQSWVRCAPRLPSGIAVHTDNSVWVSGADIGRSTDRCASWTNTSAGRFSDNVASLRGEVYGLTDLGLLRWGGTAWTPVATSLDGGRFLSMTATGSALIAGTDAGITRSLDGVTWTTATAGLPDLSIVDVYAGPNRAYAITGGAPGGIACSNVDGTVWTTCFTRGGFSVLADRSNDNGAFAGVYDDMVVTVDIFATVTTDVRFEVGLDDALVLDIVEAADRTVVVATDRGVFAAPPVTPFAFEPRLTGLDAWDVDAMVRDGDDVYIATRGGVLHATGGAPFTASTAGITGNTTIRSIAVNAEGHVLAGGRNIVLSTDHGETWTMVLALDAQDGYLASSIDIVGGTRAYVGTAVRILVADPPYTTWTERRFTQNSRVDAMRVVDGELWAGTTRGLFHSTDDGATFTRIHTMEQVRAITVLPDGGLAVGTLSNLYFSDATRTTWSTALPARNITSITTIGSTIVVTTEDGVSYSTDRGVTWQPVPGVETTSASALLYDGTLVVGTNSGLVRVALP